MVACTWHLFSLGGCETTAAGSLIVIVGRHSLYMGGRNGVRIKYYMIGIKLDSVLAVFFIEIWAKNLKIQFSYMLGALSKRNIIFLKAWFSPINLAGGGEYRKDVGLLLGVVVILTASSSCNFLTCFLRSKLRQNPFWHMWHVNGFCSLWVCMWNVKL